MSMCTYSSSTTLHFLVQFSSVSVCTRCNLMLNSLSVIFNKCVVSPGVSGSSANKSDSNDIAKILLKSEAEHS